jgi:hypothetical protein
MLQKDSFRPSQKEEVPEGIKLLQTILNDEDNVEKIVHEARNQHARAAGVLPQYQQSIRYHISKAERLYEIVAAVSPENNESIKKATFQLKHL